MSNRFLAKAHEGKNQWWRYVLGTFLILLFFQVLGFIPIELYMDSADPSEFTAAEWYEYQSNSDYISLGLDKNIGLTMLILGFIIGLGALLLVYKYLHRKPLLSLFTSYSSIRWRHVAFGFVGWGLLSLVLLVIQLFTSPEDYVWQFEACKFFPLLLVCIFLLPFQTTFEELFLRGYLFQGIGILTKYPIVPVVVTSLFFMLLHIANPEVEAYGWYLMMPYYFGVAFTAALITLMDEGLEIAIGLHAANNIFGALTLTYSEAVIKTDALWMGTDEDFTLGTLVIFYTLFFVMIYGTYRYLHRQKHSKAT